MRETNNPLLLKAEIGKPLKRGFVMPPDQFSFGKTSDAKIIGAKETITWPVRVKPLHKKEKKPPRDFISLNKAATRAGLVTTDEHFQYRTMHERGEKIKSDEVCPSTDTVCDVFTKTSATGFDLHDEQMKKKYDEQMKKKDHNKRIHNSYGETRASRLRRYSPPVDPPPLWQMAKFQRKASPALQTFRSEEVRRKAFVRHASDCTARTGVFGHGNYQSAKS